jgi:hypothetical protein
MFLISSGVCIGGLVFAPFLDIGFAQISVICIAAGHRGVGHGTRLMNALKRELCQRADGQDITVMAESPEAEDGFFEWQGFHQLKALNTSVKRKWWTLADTNPVRACLITADTPLIAFKSEAKEVAVKRIQRLFDAKCSKRAQFGAIVRQAVDQSRKEQQFASYLSRKPSLALIISHPASRRPAPRSLRGLLRQLHLPHWDEALRLQLALMVFSIFVLLMLAYFLKGK